MADIVSPGSSEGGGDNVHTTRCEGREMTGAGLAGGSTTHTGGAGLPSAHITHLGKLDLLSVLTPSPHLTSPHLTSPDRQTLHTTTTSIILSF